jgi:hypothetical protein
MDLVMKFLIISLILIAIFITVAVSKTPKSNSDMAEHYFEELDKTPKTIKVVDVENKFLKLFADFKIGAKEEIIRQTYAENFYFNDTFKVINDIETLIPYMTETAQTVKSTTVKILDTAYSGSDYYIRWVMVMEFDVKGKDIYSRSTGMTQLRFNSEGKIIFHQDFWDSTEGFYQHLPYIGYFVRKIRSKL